jgi:hypothetical protein
MTTSQSIREQEVAAEAIKRQIERDDSERKTAFLLRAKELEREYKDFCAARVEE